MSDLSFELSIYVGNMIFAVLFGIQVYMCFHASYLMSRGPPSERRKNNFYIAYSVIMLILTAISLRMNGQLMWTNHRDYPGGSLAYYFATSSVWFEVFAAAAVILQNYMNDALMDSIGSKGDSTDSDGWARTVISVLYCLGRQFICYCFAILDVPWFDCNFAVPRISLTTGLNLVVASLEAELLSSPGNTEATLVESALPMSVFGIVLAVFFGKSLAADIACSDVWAGLVAIAPQLIILRVAMGRAWMRNPASHFVTSHSIAFGGDSAKAILEEGAIRDTLPQEITQLPTPSLGEDRCMTSPRLLALPPPISATTVIIPPQTASSVLNSVPG
ncbi:hypothetical protein CPB84DRAFT_1846104 [Gymnopilus junonius]|uniref:Uncharacterized protein n=1 Tax=Gymnopilus junonius TaxID=109634 RepID=A0A9P5NQ49_GYMJU|nr:hypothetical protein CPB84DRAFT_1846104 [Gymnopilus junonius]